MNRRVASTKTITHSSGTALTDPASWTDNSNFDDYGHYRLSIDSGNFPSVSSRTRFTNYAPSISAWTWLPNLYTEQCVVEGSVATASSCSGLGGADVVRTSFDSSTGALTARRTLFNPNADGALHKNDLLQTYEYDGHGNVLHERSYGGTQELSVLETDPFAPGAANAVYDITHTWTYGNGEPITHKAKYAPFAALIADDDIDKYSGLVKTQRDAAGIATTTNYDAAGRMQYVSQTGLATTSYQYTDPSYLSVGGLVPSKVQVAMASGQGLGSIASQYQYDALGRLYRQKTYMPDSTWSLVETEFYSWGAKKSVSSMEGLPPEVDEFAFTPSHKTVFTGYDAFDRVGTITAPDLTKTQYTYTGVKSMLRASKNADDTQVARATEDYDWRGRLVKVTEPSGPLNADVETSYTYDVADRLRSVYSADSGATQNRTFTYDHRGFLTGETHPEKAPFGVQYSDFDARGHAGRRQDGGVDGQFDLVFVYDGAERLTTVSEHFSTTRVERLLKEFSFADANGVAAPTDYKAGKLTSAVRHNYTKTRGDVKVTEAFTYTGPGGRLAQRATTINVSGNDVQTFTTPVTWDDLGKPKNIGYPACATPSQCTRANSVASVDQLFTNGALTRVGPSAAPFATLSYHDNGVLEKVAHGGASSTITDVYDKDDNGMSRPAKISFNANSQCSVPAPVISVVSFMCAGTSASASVNVQTGASYTWTVSGGTPTSAATGSSITFTAGASGNVTLTVAAVNGCGNANSTPAVVAIGATTAIVQQPSNASIAPGGQATLQVAVAGDSLSYQWYRGATNDLSNPISQASLYYYVASPSVTTSYWVRVTGACGVVSSATATVTVSCPLPAPVISTAPAICPNDSTNAYVTAVTGTTYVWTITGGTPVSGTNAAEFIFTAGASGNVTLNVTATNSCGSKAATPAVVAIHNPPAITQQPSGATIMPGGQVTLNVGATGAGLNYRWYIGQPGNTSNPAAPGSYSSPYVASPAVTTTYWVRVFGTCTATDSAAATVTVYTAPVAPTGLLATTQISNSRSVVVQWNAVTGATAGYQVRRATSLAGPFLTVGIPVTTLSITDTVPASADPVAYVYVVAAVDAVGESPNRSLPDYAVAATTLFSDDPLLAPTVIGTFIKGAHVAELRKAIDALRVAAGLAQTWPNAMTPTGLIVSSDYSSMKTPFDAARQAFGRPAFAWSGVAAPAANGPVLREHIQQLRDALR
jgi:YD repeat-containing protein